MNTLIAPQRPERRPFDGAVPLQHPLNDLTPRTSLPDRVALRLALALLLWSTRPTRAQTPASRQRELDRIAREHAWQLRCHRLPLL
ncbi:hypothetical protein LJR045_001579 [Microbacterium sp. LjRoot45]|uniref:hypothetical protein n=1 Tax=Microbacterium sp. LjRoot45 TaxID=3342329 RepID=UPI003ECC6290